MSVTFDSTARPTTRTCRRHERRGPRCATISYDAANGQAPVNAGSYIATGTFADDDCTVASATAAIVIAKATPTVTVLPVSTTFDGAARPTTGTVAA